MKTLGCKQETECSADSSPLQYLLVRQSCRRFPSVPHSSWRDSVLLNNTVPCTATECSPKNTMDGLQVAVVIKAVSPHSGTLQFLFSLCRAGPASGLSSNLHINAYLSTKGGNIRKKCTGAFSRLNKPCFSFVTLPIYAL